MGFFDIFRKSVKKTKQSLSLELDSFSGKITFDTLEELEEILILADVGVTTAGKICSRLGERIKRRNIDSTELRENLCEIVTELMEPDEPLVTETKPSVVLVVGVNGVGKTTSIGKLAYWLQGQGKKVLLGAADTFRAHCDDTDTLTFCDDGDGNEYFYYPPSMPWHRTENEPDSAEEVHRRIIKAVQCLTDLSEAEIEKMINDDLYVCGCG